MHFQKFNHACHGYAKPRFSLWKQKPGNPQEPHAPLKYEVDVEICQNAIGPAELDLGLIVFFPKGLHGFSFQLGAVLKQLHGRLGVLPLRA